MDNDIEFDEQDNGRNPLRERMKQLESENAALKAKAEAAAAVEREIAFLKAGIDPNLPVAKYFMRGYDGELTIDAIKAAAIEAQILQDTQKQQMQSDAAKWAKTNDAAAGNTAGEAPADFVTRIANAKSAAEVEMLLAEAQAAQ